jgi:dTDP-4-amino-4,6-dideoxygalactose transaminase
LRTDHVPILPVLSFAVRACRYRPPARSLLSVSGGIAVNSGTAAISLAVRHAGIGAGDVVLLPAYHCKSMVSAATSSGASVGYFRVKPDLSVDLDSMESLFDVNVRAILVAHYFGFPQAEIARIRSLCDARGVLLIEDCAHAFLGTTDGQPGGTCGDYVVASIRKFLPVADGGLLLSKRRDLSGVSVAPSKIRHEIKALIDIFEEAVEYGRPFPLGSLIAPIFRLKRLVRRRLRRGGTRAIEAVGSGNAPETDCAVRAMTRVSGYVMRHACLSRNALRRRDNYNKLAMGFADLRFAKPLLARLPDDAVPYMFPLNITHGAERAFPALKKRGVPIYRWEEMPEGICPVTDRFRWTLLQLPCHQALRDSELDWLIKTVRREL